MVVPLLAHAVVVVLFQLLVTDVLDVVAHQIVQRIE